MWRDMSAVQKFSVIILLVVALVIALVAVAKPASVTQTVVGRVPRWFPMDSARLVMSYYDVSADQLQEFVYSHTDTSDRELTYVLSFEDQDWVAPRWEIYGYGNDTPYVTPIDIQRVRFHVGLDTIKVVHRLTFPSTALDSTRRVRIRGATTIGSPVVSTAKDLYDTLAITNDSLPYQWAYEIWLNGDTAPESWLAYNYDVAAATDTVSDTVLLDTIVITTADFCITDAGGLDTIRIYAKDTLNDVYIAGARVSVYNAAGQPVGGTLTNDSGYVMAVLINAQTYNIRVYQPLFYPYSGSLTAAAQGIDSIETGRLPYYTSHYVSIYANIGSGIIDSTTGEMLPRNAQFTLNLIGEPTLNNGTWAILPAASTKRPNSEGKVEWIVPANTMLVPAGSYYEVSYSAFDNTNLIQGVFKKFTIDTSSVPIDILDATEAL